MNDEIAHVFIGYDPRDARAYEVCRWSVCRRASIPVHTVCLNQKSLRWSGLYRRAPEPGTWIDSSDHKPFSTEFTFTRFLVPHLMQRQGWALFCDADFLFLSDIAGLWKLRDQNYAAMVVKHRYRPKETSKMDGAVQTSYPRKNWSSLILWNCEHDAHERLTPDVVNLEPGAYLHGFGWLEDDQIGPLPESWNWLEGHSPDMEKDAIHYTRGGPWFEECANVGFAREWTDEERAMLRYLERK